MIYAI